MGFIDKEKNALELRLSTSMACQRYGQWSLVLNRAHLYCLGDLFLRLFLVFVENISQ